MPRLNLRNKLLLFSIVIAIIPLVIAGQSLIRIAQDEMKSSANDQLVGTARQVAGEIDALFEHAWLAPLILIRNAVDGEGLGVQEKIALLKHGIADLPDVVALQVTVEGGRPLVVSQDLYSRKLQDAQIEPLSVLRTPAEKIGEAVAKGQPVQTWVDYVPQIDGWLATIAMPLQTPIAGSRASISARIDLTRVRSSIFRNPFQRTGSIVIVDAMDGRFSIPSVRICANARSLRRRYRCWLQALRRFPSIAIRGPTGKSCSARFRRRGRSAGR
jgi:adenylate cyclase